MSTSLRVYIYDQCGTCRNAVKFLREHGVAHELVPIRQQPPSVAELRAMLGYAGGEVRRLFNSSGLDYKALHLKDRLPKLSTEEALELLASNGNLVKRPFALGEAWGTVGFKLPEWEKLVAQIR